MIKAVFFDVANTLLDKPDLYINIQGVLTKHGHAVAPAVLKERHRLLSEVILFPDKTSREFYVTFNSHLLFSLGIIPTPQLLDDVFAACTYLPWQPFEDVSALTDITLPKGVISNWDRSLPEKLKTFIPLEFQWILGSEEMQVRKPEPAFFERALAHAGLKPDDVLYIGDSIKLDIQPALALGIRAVLIDRLDLYAGSSLERVRSFHDLRRFL